MKRLCSSVAATLALCAFGALAQTPPLPSSLPAPKVVNPYGINKDELKELATNGARILDVQTGYLDGKGRIGALVVLNPSSAGPQADSGTARTLLLVDRDAQGSIRKLAQNEKIVPCAKCGGVAGDPYSYARITAPGHFIVVTEGGSRWHWSNQYRFRYASKLSTWVVESVVREVTDTVTGRKRQIRLSSKRLGVIKLDDFDPATLPQIKLD